MHNANRQAWAAVSVACLSLSLFFTSCKKSGSDPSPQDSTNTTLACQPTEERGVGNDYPSYTYSYDGQGRVIGFTTAIPDGSSYRQEPTSISYVGDTIHVRSFSTLNTFKYVRSGGRIAYHITGFSSDRYDYLYSGDRLVRVYAPSARINGQLGAVKDTILYDNATGLPAKLISTYRPEDGTEGFTKTSTFAYESRNVAFSPYSPFLIAPGLETIKVDRMLKQVTYESDLDPSMVETVTYSTAYDAKGNPQQVTTTAFGTNYVTAFTYDCR